MQILCYKFIGVSNISLTNKDLEDQYQDNYFPDGLHSFTL